MEEKSMKNLLRVLLGLLLAIGLSSYLSAQGTLTGVVHGKVTDSVNNPIQGCTVYFEGPSLQGQMTFITTETGLYRFSAVPPGQNYQLIFEIPGFKTIIRQGLAVSIGKTTAISINLETSADPEEVTIAGESLPIDAKSSKTAVNYPKSYIYNIPLSRDLYDVLNSIPGSVSEDVNYRRTSNIAGGSVRGNQYSVDGLIFNDPEVMYPMTAINIDVYEEVEMGLFGHSAEVGIADGGFINIVTKSGSNEFHGGGSVEYYNKGLVEDLLSEEDMDAIGLDAPSGLNSWRDFSLSIGGPILSDTAWFFANGRFFKWTQDFNHIIYDETLSAGQRIYTLDEVPHKESNIFGKLTIQPTPDIRFLATYNLSMVNEDYFTINFNSNDDITATSKWDGEIGHALSGQLYWILSQDLFVDIRMGYIRRYFPLRYSEDADPNLPRYYDEYYDIFKNNPPFQETSLRSRLNPSVTVTFFRDNLLGAAHEIKFGAEYEAVDAAWDWWRENPFMIHYYKGGPSDPTSTQPNRYRIFAFNSGPREESSVQKNQMRRLGAFFQDSITIAERLTLNLGLRFDTSRGSFPVQKHAASADLYLLLAQLGGSAYSSYSLPAMKALDWTHFSPRIGFAYNLFNDGTTIIKGSWSRYNESLMIQYFSQINPLSPDTGWWYWYDDNENQITEISYDRFSIPQYLPLDPLAYEIEKEMDTDATAPYTDEFTLGVERELGHDFSITMLGIFKHKKDIFDNVNDFGLGKDEAWKGYSQDSDLWKRFDYTDPGEDGQWNTEDDTSGYLYGERAGTPDYHEYFMNIEGGFRKYMALQLILQKRMSHGWQLLASLAWSKTWGNIGGAYDSSGGAAGAFDTPNSYLYNDGRLDYDRPLVFKIQSTVILPFDIFLSSYFSHRSGSPWRRTVTVYLPEDDADFRFPGEEYTVPSELNGTRRTSSLTTLDIRLEKRIRVGDGFSIGGYVDILNALGSSGYGISANPGGYIDYNDLDSQGRPSFERYSTFGDVTGAYGKRIFKFSLRFMF